MGRYVVAIGFLIGLVAGAAVWQWRTPPAPPAPDGVIRVGIYSLSPAKGSPLRAQGPPSIYVMNAIFDTLVEPGPGGIARQGLAVSWMQLSPNTWSFALWPNVHFSNGEPVDATAVVTTFERLLHLAEPTPLSGMVANIAAVEARGPMSVEFTTKVPSPTFPTDIAGIWIVPPKAWDAAGSETAFARAPIGSGPYVVTAWDENQVTMTANKKSWRRPLADGLVFAAIGDEAARLSALLSGGIDMAVQTSPDAIAAIEEGGGRVLITPGGTVGVIALNATRPGSPFADRRVRQAVNYAVNKDDIAQVLFHGTATAMSQPASPITAGYDPAIAPYPYDPTRARALLAEAGFADGFDLTIEVSTNALPADAATFSAVARDLTAVGVRTTVRALPLPILFERLFKNTNEGLGFQLGFISMPQLDTVKAMADFNCDRPGAGGPFICIAELQALVEQARRELDPARRGELLRQINHLAHDEALALFLVDGVDLIGAGPRLMGDAPTTRFYHWENFSLVD